MYSRHQELLNVLIDGGDVAMIASIEHVKTLLQEIKEALACLAEAEGILPPKIDGVRYDKGSNSENFKNGWNEYATKAKPLYAKLIRARKQIIKDIFEWEVENGIVSICSNHQTPKPGCHVCNAMINVLREKAGAKPSEDFAKEHGGEHGAV